MSDVKRTQIIKLIAYIIGNVIFFIALNAENQLLSSMSIDEIVLNHLSDIAYYLLFAFISVFIGACLIIQMKKLFNEYIDISFRFCILFIGIVILIIVICIWLIQNPILRIALSLIAGGAVLGNSK